MNLQTLLGVIIGVAVVGGGAWYLSTTPPAPAGEPSGAQEGGTGTFAQLMSLGGSQQCEVVLDSAVAPATATVYLSGGEVRADVLATPAIAGMQVRAHMIQTGGYVYSWTDMVPKGVRVALAQGTGAAASQGFDMNATVSYECSPWVPDASKFEVPSDVTFMEVGADGSISPQ